MTCEEFELVGLDLETIREDDRRSAPHGNIWRSCPRCARVHENWQTLRVGFACGGAETQESGGPARVGDAAAGRSSGRAQDREGAAGCCVCGLDAGAAAVFCAAVSWVKLAA